MDDERLMKIKTIYLDWYNSEIADYIGTSKALFLIGELLIEEKK